MFNKLASYLNKRESIKYTIVLTRHYRQENIPSIFGLEILGYF